MFQCYANAYFNGIFNTFQQKSRNPNQTPHHLAKLRGLRADIQMSMLSPNKEIIVEMRKCLVFLIIIFLYYSLLILIKTINQENKTTVCFLCLKMLGKSCQAVILFLLESIIKH